MQENTSILFWWSNFIESQNLSNWERSSVRYLFHFSHLRERLNHFSVLPSNCRTNVDLEVLKLFLPLKNSNPNKGEKISEYTNLTGCEIRTVRESYAKGYGSTEEGERLFL